MTLKRDELELASQSDDPVYAGLARQMLAADDKVQVKRKDTGRVVWVTKDNANDPEYEKPDGKPGDDETKKDEPEKGDESKKDDDGDTTDEKAPPEVVKKKEKWEAGWKPSPAQREQKLDDFMGRNPSQSDANTFYHLGDKPTGEWDKNDWDVAQYYPGFTQKDFAWMADEAEDRLNNPEKAKKNKDKKKEEKTKKQEEAKKKHEDHLNSVSGPTKEEKAKKKEDKPKKKEDKPKKKLDGKDLSALREWKKSQEKAKATAENAAKKDGDKSKKTDAQMMQEFESKASPEMKERMEGMSPAEFKEMLAAISDEDEDMGKAASLRKDLIRVASVMRPSLKRTALIQMLAADDKVQVKRKDTGRLVWVTRDNASDPDYEKVKDAPKEESSKDKPEKKEKSKPKVDVNIAPDRKSITVGGKTYKGKKAVEAIEIVSQIEDPGKAKAEADEIMGGLMEEMGDMGSGDKKQHRQAVSALRKFKQDLYDAQHGKKAMTLRKTLIRVASTMAPSPERTQLIQILAASKDPDGGDEPDEGGGDEGSEDPNEHPGEGDGGDDENGIEGSKRAGLKLGSKLSKEQIEEVRGEMGKGGLPVRFMSGGESMDIITGKKTGKGANVMHQLVYWNFPKETSKKIAKWLGVRAEFSKSASVKVASFPYLDPRSKNLGREGIRDGGLTKSVMRAGDGFALYNVDKGKNHSKFYEGMVMPDDSMPGSHRAVFRWGAMTDNGFKGRVDGKKYDEKFRGLTEAQALKALQTKKRAKLGRGYVDTFGSKHVDPVTGKRLKQGEYPVGLARGVGFGWGVQEMAFCVPALRQIGEQIAAALDPNDGTSAVVDLKAALRLVSGVPDSNMAAKITKYIGGAMREINRGADPRVIEKKLWTINNYINKQVALCD